MKKTIYIILVLLIVISCTKKNNVSKVNENSNNTFSISQEIVVPEEFIGIWVITNPNYSFLKIDENGKFVIRNISVIYEGIVKIENNKIVLPYSENLYCGPVGEFENIEEINLVFPNKEDTFLSYNPDYKDFNYKTCLENSNNKFPSREYKSEEGQVYELDGFEVTKINKKILSTENMKLRVRPSSIEKELFAEYQWPYAYPNSEQYYPIESEINVLLKGYICFTDAVTVKKDKIENIESPWYHIYTGGGEESFPRAAWIWGGYCLDVNNLTEEEKNNYIKIFENEAIQKGLIQKSDE